MPLVNNPDDIKLAMIGMVDGNGHPFSWSAIINGRYDQQVMANCGYPTISEYLDAQSPDNLGIEGMSVSRVDAELIQKTLSRINRSIQDLTRLNKSGSTLGRARFV